MSIWENGKWRASNTLSVPIRTSDDIAMLVIMDSRACPVTHFHRAGNGRQQHGHDGTGVAIPESDLVVVITSTNYNTRGMHQQTERPLKEFTLPEFAQ